MAAERIGVTVGVTFATKITELLANPTRRQLRYVFCFNSIVEELKKEEKNLMLARDRVQNKVNMALRNAEEIEKDVEEWMTETNTVIDDVQRLKIEIEKYMKYFDKWCSSWIWRYSFNKKVAKKAVILRRLWESGKFDTVSYQAPLSGTEFFPSKDFTPSKSSRKALNQIMVAVKDDDVNMIGLYGMGGVGKTTLVKEASRKATMLKLFDQVLMVVVSQAQDVIKIQDQMADKLGLNFDVKTTEGRARRLHKRLKNEKKILIILDDVWRYLDLKDIGIPHGDDHKGCKILLTTRLRRVCASLNCQRDIPLHVLTESEAWALFKNIAGLHDCSSDLNNVAVKVVRKCKGLPLAIVTVGRALRDKSFSGWKVALQKLKSSRLIDIRDVDKDKNAYACLKLSFDHLQCEETKLCLLLCSLFPEDYEIFVEDLARYAVGLGFYQDAQSIDDVRSEVFEAIGDLKASCLLLETESEGHVKLHDMVRDFALWVGSRVEQAFRVRARVGLEEWPKTGNSDSYTAMSLMNNNVRELPARLVCPKLQLLLLARKRALFCREETITVPDTVFEGVKELKVLSLAHGFLSMQSLEFLTNLQTLELKYCYINWPRSGKKRTDLALFQMLKRLKILSFFGSFIEELPEEIGELDNLRVLDLRSCKLLVRIPSNLIRRLSKLEELYIGSSSFKKWEVEGTCKQGSNASLMELKSLSHLDTVWLNYDEFIQKDFAFPNLNGYYVHINCGCTSDSSPSGSYPTSRTICLGPTGVTTLKACKELFQNVYDLHLLSSTNFCNILPEMDGRGFNELASLKLLLCDFGCLVDTKQRQAPAIAFSNLKVIDMCKTGLRKICHGLPPEGFLEKLQTLKLYGCYHMVQIFPAKLWKTLQTLEKVIVRRCSDLQEVFELHRLNEVNANLLSCLTTLELQELPELRSIWKGPTHNVSLKNLTHLILNNCRCLTSVFSPSLAQSLVHIRTIYIGCCDQIKHIIAEKVEDGEKTFSKLHLQPLSLRNLQTLTIYECNRLEYIFPISIARGFMRLEKIIIVRAVQLAEFFRTGEQVILSPGGNNSMSLQQKNLELKCSSPHSCCSGDHTAVFPSLQHLEFTGCPKLLIHSIAELLVPSKLLSEFGVLTLKCSGVPL
ncbi:probable disease resistance protein At4g27220 isoform X2 [Ricinus communis]|uniref:probable disease resistance protein At4g27220 isoform X2 n=1 Tax=Ricinus communis TaxID=3988 RepID=UPI00201A7FFE|nr:probable disease resistance protein At4g27220 isoform X2 [Ricinus communis]